jgi:hypothetical protein
MSRLSVELDQATQHRMKAVMLDLGFKSKSTFIVHCIKVALKSHHFDANLGFTTYAHTQDSNLSKERIYNAESSTLPQQDFSETKVDVKNDLKKSPLQFLPPNWQPPEHLRHKYCIKHGLRYADALELFFEMAKETEAKSRNWDATWAIKVKKGVLKSVKPVEQDDDYLRPEDTMAFQLAR